MLCLEIKAYPVPVRQMSVHSQNVRTIFSSNTLWFHPQCKNSRNYDIYFACLYACMCKRRLQYIVKPQLLWILISCKTLGFINWDREADLFLNVSYFTVSSQPHIPLCSVFGQYIRSVLRWLLTEPKKKKKISWNLAPEPKRHVPRFHLNVSTLRGLSKLIIQISCKKVNSRKLLWGGGGKNPPKNKKKKNTYCLSVENASLLAEAVETAFLHFRSYLTLHSSLQRTDL